MIRGDEWKGDLMAPNGKRETPAAPSASGPKWTAEEVDCIVLAFDACKLNPARFHAEYNDVTEGRQRTLAELRLHLPRVAKARGFEVPQKFLDDCDAVIDGVTATAATPPVTDEAVSLAWLRGVWSKLDHSPLYPYNLIGAFGAIVFGDRDPDAELAQRIRIQEQVNPRDLGWVPYPPPVCESKSVEEWWCFSPGPYAEAFRVDLRVHDGKIEMWGFADDNSTSESWHPLTSEMGIWWRRVVPPDLPGDKVTASPSGRRG